MKVDEIMNLANDIQQQYRTVEENVGEEMEVAWDDDGQARRN